MRRIHSTVLFACVTVLYANGQVDNRGEVHILQDSLVKLGHIMYNEPSEPERLKANFTFVKTLVSALQTPHSYSFPFDSVDMVSILKSPDDKFRIFSWHIQLNDGSFLYYGTIQLNTTDGRLKMYPLLDKTYEMKAPEMAITASSEWYGAQYYRIIPLGNDYVLLGWKGYTPNMTQKVIEVLHIGSDSARLGKSIFEGGDTGQNTRMIYRYNRQASMHLDYDTLEHRIVMDHLAPADVRYKEQYEQYGPDMTYDAWKLEKGRLVLVSDIPLMNLPDSKDEQYNDPRKPSNHPKSGLPPQ
ncbi:hypothetical protein [Parapedobacter tibetensis]|nr:hypothetical protein [Parapedobacter tibetensis]